MMWLQHSNFFTQILLPNPLHPLLPYSCFPKICMARTDGTQVLVALHSPRMEIDNLGPSVQLRPNSQCGIVEGHLAEPVKGSRCRLNALEQLVKAPALFDFLQIGQQFIACPLQDTCTG